LGEPGTVGYKLDPALLPLLLLMPPICDGCRPADIGLYMPPALWLLLLFMLLPVLLLLLF
jgi:hypothetical protein